MVILVSVVCTLVIAFFSGAVGSLLGLDGGVVIVPLLIFLLDVPLHIASGASIIAVVAISTIAVGTYVREELTNIRLEMFLEFATTLGAVTGAILTSVTDDSVLRIVFRLYLLYATVTMYLQLRSSGGRSWRQKPDDWLAGRLKLGG